MRVDFIFQFVLDSSGCNDDGLSHHKSEQSGEERTADQYSGIDEDNSEISPIISHVFYQSGFVRKFERGIIFINDINGLPDVLNLVDRKKVTQNNE